eukprot:jgi/Chrpa1/13338/Chrysochromulina_OHIO_Genome00016725-RA
MNAAARAALETLEALDHATLAPFAARLTHLAARACSDGAIARAAFPILELPDALIARIMSFMPPQKLALMGALSSTFRSLHVPNAVAERAVWLELSISEREYKTAIDLLLGEEEVNRGLSSLKPLRKRHSPICAAKLLDTASLPYNPGEFVFTLTLTLCVFSTEAVPQTIEPVAYDEWDIYTHSSLLPDFPLDLKAARYLSNPHATMDKELRQNYGPAQVAVQARLFVTHSATGKWVELFQGPLSDEHHCTFIPLKRGDHVDNFLGGGYDEGSLTFFYLNLCSHGVEYRDTESNSENDADELEGEADAETEKQRVTLGMWSEQRTGSHGPYVEAFNHQEYERGRIHPVLVKLLRSIEFRQDPRDPEFESDDDENA